MDIIQFLFFRQISTELQSVEQTSTCPDHKPSFQTSPSVRTQVKSLSRTSIRPDSSTSFQASVRPQVKLSSRTSIRLEVESTFQTTSVSVLSANKSSNSFEFSTTELSFEIYLQN